MSTLSRLLGTPRAPNTAVAVRLDQPSQPPGIAYWLEFKQCVSGLREQIAAAPPGPWVVLTDDPYAFAVAVFALWHSGRHAISPPNSQPEALRALDSRAVGVLTDRADWFPGALPVHPLRHQSTGEPAPLAPLDRDALALELFTSGTTGRPKGAMIPHRQVLWNCINTAVSWGLTENDVSPVFTPLFHAGGLFAFLTPLFYLGGRIILARGFDSEQSLRTIIEERCTVILGVPTLFQMWLDSSRFATANFDQVRFFISGEKQSPSIPARAIKRKRNGTESPSLRPLSTLSA